MYTQSIEAKTKIEDKVFYHTLTFKLKTVDQAFRDNVIDMIQAALAGAEVQGETDEKLPAMGFMKEEEEE